MIVGECATAMTGVFWIWVGRCRFFSCRFLCRLKYIVIVCCRRCRNYKSRSEEVEVLSYHRPSKL